MSRWGIFFLVFAMFAQADSHFKPKELSYLVTIEAGSNWNKSERFLVLLLHRLLSARKYDICWRYRSRSPWRFFVPWICDSYPSLQQTWKEHKYVHSTLQEDTLSS